MQSVSSRIWTRVAVFISYDDNRYTTGTSETYMLICVSISLVSAYMQTEKQDFKIWFSDDLKKT